MHEPAIAAELIELAQKEITQAGHSNVSVSSKATLIIEHSPVRGSCRHCGADFEPAEPIFLCASCGSGDLEIRQGNELDLISMTIDTV
jgi:Zn finger protein HypA/HybF involved in hydrogenase expression